MTTIAPGAHLELRDAVWRVVKVDPTENGTQAWHVVGVSEIVRDQEALFLAELEDDVRVLDPKKTALVPDPSGGHLDSLLYMQALLQDVPPTTPDLYVGHKAAMDVMDFQLEPAAKALAQPRQRILIADAVGLGKTLEAGILLSELIRRGRGKRILIATVKAMLTQFQKELWGRFAIPLVRLDSVGLQRIRQHLPSDQNPFYYYDRVIISIDTLKQHNAFRTHIEQAHWDVVVIDEAHNVAKRGGGKALRHGIAKVLADKADAMIMLSATPHDGKAESFASLMNMLDPTAIANPKDYTREEIDGLFVRRFKGDVQKQLGTAFPARTVAEGIAQATPAEEAAYAVLADLEFTRIDQHRSGHLLFKSTLKKALFSSPAACRKTIEERIKRIRAREKRGEVPVGAYAHDIAELERLDAALAQIGTDDFSKAHKLLQVIQSKRQGIGWSKSKRDDRLVIFSERIETLRFLEDFLTDQLGLKQEQVALLHGGLPDTTQQEIVEAFGQEKSKLRLLLASDVASEGLNLHYLCHKLIHFDVPWSLMVFQQRNGRVDRYGQTRPPKIVYMHTQTATPIEGDRRILELLQRRDSAAHENIEDPSAFLGVFDIDEQERMTEEAMRKGADASKLGKALTGTGTMNKLEAMLRAKAAAAEAGRSTAPTPTTRVRRRTPPSLFASDTAWLRTALEWMRERDAIDSFEVMDKGHTLRLSMPEDLIRRFKRLPPEALPADHRLLLTSDREAMQQAITDARGEETAWPELQYLWPLHPVLEWCADKARGVFGRHAAPVLSLHEGLDADQAVVVVSGLLPNRRAQPVVHHWFAVHFHGGTLKTVEPFADFAERVQLGRRELVNWSPALHLPSLNRLRSAAVDAARDAIMTEKKAFEADMVPRLARERDRLKQMRTRQLDQIELDFKGGRHTRKKTDAELRIEKIFERYNRWVDESMGLSDTPFMQLVAVLRAHDGFGGAA